MVTQGYSAADFRHGPIAMLNRGFPVVALASSGKAKADMIDMITEIKRTGADLSVFSNNEDLLSISESYQTSSRSAGMACTDHNNNSWPTAGTPFIP